MNECRRRGGDLDRAGAVRGGTGRPVPSDVWLALQVWRALPADCRRGVADAAKVRPWRRRLAGLEPAELRVELVEAAARLGSSCQRHRDAGAAS